MKWVEMREQIENDLDLQEETFIQPEDLKNWANEAIDEAEKLVNTLTEGTYFEDEVSIDMVADQAVYDLPETIFGNKITNMYFNDPRPEYRYEIAEVRSSREIVSVCDTDDYKYKLKNTPTGVKVNIYPTPKNDVAGGIRLFFIRQASKIVNGDSVIDIPEAHAFIKQYIKDQCVNKEKLTPDAPESASLSRKRADLILTLQKQTQTDNNQVPIYSMAYCDHN